MLSGRMVSISLSSRLYSPAKPTETLEMAKWTLIWRAVDDNDALGPLFSQSLWFDHADKTNPTEKIKVCERAYFPRTEMGSAVQHKRGGKEANK